MVSALDIKRLREVTGAGVLDCKNALADSGGDAEKAKEILRTKGLNKAGKKGDRKTGEGLVGITFVDDRHAAVFSLKAETDFVAKNDRFINLAKEISSLINKDFDTSGREQLLTKKTTGGESLQDLIASNISIIGENIILGECDRIAIDKGVVIGYIHNVVAEGLGKIAVLLAIECDNVDDKVKAFGKQLAMHIAASSPIAIKIEDIPADLLEKEREIALQQSSSSGKPPEIIEKIVAGRMRKFYQEVVLMEQYYVLDNNLSVAQALADFSKKNGGQELKIAAYKLYRIG